MQPSRCNFVSIGNNQAQCANQGCGKLINGYTNKFPITRCKAAPTIVVNFNAPSKKGLGDWLEEQLISVGVTKERWAEFVSQNGLPGGCGGCDARQEWLNKVGNWFGEAASRIVGAL